MLVCKSKNFSYIRKNTIVHFLLYSEYSVHYTRLTSSDSGSVKCLVRPTDQTVKEIETLGSPNLKVIKSPGFDLNAK